MNYQDLFDNTGYRSFVKVTTPKTAEHRANISKAQIGRESTDTQRAKISASLKEAYANGTRTKVISAERRAKTSATLKGKPPTRNIPRIQTPLGLFDSQKKACEAYSTHRGKMLHWLKTRPNEFYYVV